MRYNRLGKSGLVVSELCLGAMTFGNRPSAFFQHDLDQAGSTALVKQALDAGINFIDTANVYSAGQSEEFLGRALRDLAIAPRPGGHRHQGHGSDGRGAERCGLFALSSAASGRRQPRSGCSSTMSTSTRSTAGTRTPRWKRACARWRTSSVRAARAMSACRTGRRGRSPRRSVSRTRRGWDKYVSLQAFYAVSGRDLERELVPLLTSEGLGLMVWSPLAGGLLSGKYARDEQGNVSGEGRRAKLDFPRVDKETSFAAVDAMQPMAEARGVSVAAVALAWLLHRPAVSSVIVGVKRAEQLAQNLAASDIELTSEELATLEPIGALEPEYPGWAIAAQSQRHGFRVSPRRRSE